MNQTDKGPEGNEEVLQQPVYTYQNSKFQLRRRAASQSHTQTLDSDGYIIIVSRKELRYSIQGRGK